MKNKNVVWISLIVLLIVGSAILLISSAMHSNPVSSSDTPVVSTSTASTMTDMSTSTMNMSATTSVNATPAVVKPVAPNVTHTKSSTTVTPKPVVQTTSITIKNYDFSPATLTIKKGTTVTWTNQDIAKHTVSADDNSFASDFFGQGVSYSHTFTEAGTYSYHCEPHPYMKATIIVTE